MTVEYPFVGLGAPNPYDRREIIPIVTWDAVPGSVFVFKPSPIWYCSRGKAVYAEITDVDYWSVKASIDLSDDELQKEVIYEKNGDFTVLK